MSNKTKIILENLYNSQVNISRAEVLLSSLVDEYMMPVRALVVSSWIEPRLITSRTVENYSITNTFSNENIHSYAMTYKKTRGYPVQIKGHFLILISENKPPYTYIFITHEKREFFRCLVKYTEKLYPKVSQIFLTTEKMFQLLVDLQKEIKHSEVRLTKILTRSKITSVRARKKEESDITWTDLDIKSAYEKITQGGGRATGIDFQVIKDGNSIIEGSVSRDGIVKCFKGFSFMNNQIFKEVCKSANKNTKFFTGRNREILTHGQLKPLLIKYDADIFSDKKQNEKFIEILRQMPGIALSVYHSNPYIHISIVDYKAGASYEIWVLSNDHIMIVPQIKSTHAALERICSHIFHKFREGNLTEKIEQY